jgi:hypothetical protein
MFSVRFMPSAVISKAQANEKDDWESGGDDSDKDLPDPTRRFERWKQDRACLNQQQATTA